MSVGVDVEQMCSPYVCYMAGVTQAFLRVCEREWADCCMGIRWIISSLIVKKKRKKKKKSI